MMMDKSIFPDYYGDILQFTKIADIAKIKWVTKFIYLWLCQQGGLKHEEAECWQHVREVQAEEIWKGTYTSYASGAPQDTHFKFLHGVHKTNWYLKKIMRIEQLQTLSVMPAGREKTFGTRLFRMRGSIRHLEGN